MSFQIFFIAYNLCVKVLLQYLWHIILPYIFVSLAKLEV